MRGGPVKGFRVGPVSGPLRWRPFVVVVVAAAASAAVLRLFGVP